MIRSCILLLLSQGRREFFIFFSCLLMNQSAFKNPDFHVLVITSGKGGVGKTTITGNLGVALARGGQKVALIDADAGLRNLDLVLGLENRVLHTARDVLEGLCRVDQALVRDPRWPQLLLLPLARGRQRLRRTREARERLISTLQELGFQWILIDSPAGIDVGFATAISGAEQAILVTTPEITSLRDADRVAAILESQGFTKLHVLVNRLRSRASSLGKAEGLGTDTLSVHDIEEALGLTVVGAVPEDPHVLSSINRGTPLVASERLSPAGFSLEQVAQKRFQMYLDRINGERGIRTLEKETLLPVFETGSFNHSDISPGVHLHSAQLLCEAP